MGLYLASVVRLVVQVRGRYYLFCVRLHYHFAKFDFVLNWCMSRRLVFNQLVYLDFDPQMGVINKIYNLCHHVLGYP